MDNARGGALADFELRQAALASTMGHYGCVFLWVLEGLSIDCMEENEESTARFLTY